MAGQGRKIKIKFRTSAQMVDTYVTELENHDYEHEMEEVIYRSL